MEQPQTQETINALRQAAHEIRHLRKQIVEVKAEAWDVHSEIIKRLFGGGFGMSVCAAGQADAIADSLAAGQSAPQSNVETRHPDAP